jgi:hypothetical protein
VSRGDVELQHDLVARPVAPPGRESARVVERFEEPAPVERRMGTPQLDERE